MSRPFADRSAAVVFVIAAVLAVSVGVAGVAGVAGAETADATVSEGDSIQDAIDNAEPGDTIGVEPGTYGENLNVPENLDNLDIVSTGDPSETVIYNENDEDPTITIEASDVTLDGFDIYGSTYRT